MRRIVLGSILPTLFIAIWEISSRSGLLTLESLSRPSDIVRAGIGGLTDGSILVATGQTFETALLGLTFAAVVRTIPGAVLGPSPGLLRGVNPTPKNPRPVPAGRVFFLPLLMFALGALVCS